ncbi:MAG: T9SS type A sorting domain-containing protein [Cytophagaceae bacterium]|nr:T9SS type A sorting domain-containing protein [Cytophagaceae bacterium]
MSLNLESFGIPNGIYFVRIKSEDNEEQVIKLIKN